MGCNTRKKKIIGNKVVKITNKDILDKEIEYGWLEPSGKFHPVEFGNHQAWASQYLLDLLQKGKISYNEAALSNGQNVGDLLIKKGCIHTLNDLALRLASEDGYLEVVKYLVENGADIHTFDNYALKWASERGHLEVVKFLVENGANIHAHKDSALRCASKNGHLEVVKYLVENGANIHANNDRALRWTSKNGHLGANIHADNDSVLYWAKVNNHTEIVQFLKQHM